MSTYVNSVLNQVLRCTATTVSRQNVSVISPRTSFDKRLLKFSGQPSISIDTASLRFTLTLNSQSQTSTDNHEKIDTDDEQPLRGSGTKKNANTLGSTVDDAGVTRDDAGVTRWWRAVGWLQLSRSPPTA